MRKMMATVMITGMIGVAGAALAKPSLRDVPRIDNGLFAVGLADQIRKTCPQISARVFRALSTIRDLEQHAKELGYSSEEIDNHLDSDVEKERLRARAAAYFESKGIKTDVAGYCTLGRAEIARKSSVGQLLRAHN